MSPWTWFRSFYEYLISLFWSTELDITLIGLQNAGKTSLIRVLMGDNFNPNSIPTVGFAMRKVKVGSVTLKCWDLGGQPRFRTMWERYCQGVNAIVFVLDSADPETFVKAKTELHSLVGRDSLKGIPLLVLGNKRDIDGAIGVDQVIEILDLKSIANHQVSCYSISVKQAENLNSVMSWLIARK